MKQATLITYAEPIPTPPQSFGCSTCICNLGITIVAGVEKVHCKGQGLRTVQRIGCSGWWDGKDRADSWPKLPDNFRPPREPVRRETA